MTRVFIAGKLDAEGQQHAIHLLETLAGGERELRWVRPEGLHLTLRFFGELSSSRIDRVARAARVALLGCASAPLLVGGLGGFPREERARVLTLQVVDETGGLTQVHRALARAFKKIGFPKEGRPFRPHITLARGRRQPFSAADYRARLNEIDQALRPATMDEVVLYASELLPSGAVYRTIERFVLSP